MLDPVRIEIAFERFAKAVVKQAKGNLTRGGKNISKKLWNSLDQWQVNVSKNGNVNLVFSMEDYGEYQDRGVKGSDPSKSHKMSEPTPFKYTNKMPPVKSLEKWVSSRRFQFRDKKGKFKSYRDTAFIVQRSIFKKGIPQTLFFTKPFKSQFPQLPNSILEAFGDDVERFLQGVFSRS